jgi:hypothetical protein
VSCRTVSASDEREAPSSLPTSPLLASPQPAARHDVATNRQGSSAFCPRIGGREDQIRSAKDSVASSQCLGKAGLEVESLAAAGSTGRTRLL